MGSSVIRIGSVVEPIGFPVSRVGLVGDNLQDSAREPLTEDVFKSVNGRLTVKEIHTHHGSTRVSFNEINGSYRLDQFRLFTGTHMPAPAEPLTKSRHGELAPEDIRDFVTQVVDTEETRQLRDKLQEIVAAERKYGVMGVGVYFTSRKCPLPLTIEIANDVLRVIQESGKLITDMTPEQLQAVGDEAMRLFVVNEEKTYAAVGQEAPPTHPQHAGNYE